MRCVFYIYIYNIYALGILAIRHCSVEPPSASSRKVQSAQIRGETVDISPGNFRALADLCGSSSVHSIGSNATRECGAGTVCDRF